MEEPKICKVCQDTAIGFNFEVITCESCKAFFRRNASRQNSLKCHFTDNCTIDKYSRRFCQKCRLAKCFSEGMSASSILQGDKLAVKRGQYNKKRAKLDSAAEEVAGNVMRRMWATQPSDKEGEYRQKMACTLYNKCTCRCRCGMFDHDTPLHTIVEHVCREFLNSRRLMSPGSSSAGSTSSDRQQLYDLIDEKVGRGHEEEEEPPVPSVIRSMRTNTPNEWSIMDDTVMAEVKIAAEVMMTDIVQGDDNNTPDEVRVLQIMDKCIRRVIEMAKQIPAFRRLSSDDQASLLKGGCIEMGVLRGAMTYDAEEEMFRPTPQHDSFTIKMDVLKKFTGNIYQQHKQFLATFDPTLLADDTLMLLLIMITLFNPTRQNLKQVHLVVAQCDVYKAMLRRHICKHFTHRGQGTFIYNSLMTKLSELKKLDDNAVNFFVAVDPQHIGELLMEIFDLNN